MAKCSNCPKFVSEKVLDFSTKKFGRPLCMDCQKAQGGGPRQQQEEPQVREEDFQPGDEYARDRVAWERYQHHAYVRLESWKVAVSFASSVKSGLTVKEGADLSKFALDMLEAVKETARQIEQDVLSLEEQ